ncbi:uncharacterized protein LOC127256045 [Andrographis paniculata]|uniref:uncharacterized protein LOC127256045 n=1 Tax=Andrographis paniculata TaxID=175694 RepID=UPI0021E7FCBC|nr:uncharacterized protein LOC127256045 [Andrographis paniculata]XP_051137841.1 uncharacterized protein LOC127256045 [Andrographis paniculata]
MMGSIGNELYSEIIQSAATEMNRESPEAQANDNLLETDTDDAWYDDGDSIDKANVDREWEKRRNQFHTIGYRDGLIAGQETAAQEGFNIGFKESVFSGYEWGLVRGITSALACLPADLKEKLNETDETRNKFQLLHESVQTVSTTDALKYSYEEHKRKSETPKESADPSSNATTNILGNYHIQLQSLLSSSPLLEMKNGHRAESRRQTANC